MVSSKAHTVADYLAELPPERRAVVSTVRDLVNRNLPAGYVETMRWGMITWEIPLARYPNRPNGQPLAYAALAAQKNHYALYLMQACADPVHEEQLRQAYAAAGQRLDMGKSCLRFRRLDELVEGAVAAVIAGSAVDDYIARYERTRPGRAVDKRPRSADRPPPTKGGTPAQRVMRSAPAAKRPSPARPAPTPRSVASQASAAGVAKTTAVPRANRGRIALKAAKRVPLAPGKRGGRT